MMRSSWKFLALVVLAVTGCEPSEPATPSPRLMLKRPV